MMSGAALAIILAHDRILGLLRAVRMSMDMISNVVSRCVRVCVVSVAGVAIVMGGALWKYTVWCVGRAYNDAEEDWSRCNNGQEGGVV